MIKRITAVLVAAVMVMLLLPASGCVKTDWKGEWNRKGDATFSRAEMTITDVNASGFVFSMTLYNGNVAGRLTRLRAQFTDRAKREAVYDVPETRASITFTLNSVGDMEVVFHDSSVNFTETESTPHTSSASMETSVFGFDALVYITGEYTRDEVEYINYNMHDMGILEQSQSEALSDLMPEDVYIRCLDCFQLWNVGDMENSGKHNDEIGGYVYYGSNTMQTYAAIIIAFDDGSVCAAVSQRDGSIVYYSNNHIYSSGELTPLPVQKWIELYNGERAAAQQNA